MRRQRTGRLAALALVAAAPAAAADRIEVRHEAVECVPRDRYARIVASGQPAGAVAAAELQFRVAEGAPWYAIRMAKGGAGHSAELPRPTRPLERFQYRVVMRAADLQETATATVAVRVAEDPAECTGTPSSIAVGAPIVVRVPTGAPVVPPVPPGFSPAGVVAADDPKPRGAATKWVAGAGLVGVLAAGAAAAGSDQGAPPGSRPSFRFFGTSPTSGSVLSLSRDRLSVSIGIIGGSESPLSFVWRFDLLSGASGSPCAFIGNVASVSGTRPQTVRLSEPLMPSGTCGDRFTTHSARLQIMFGEELAHDQFVPVLNYRVEP